MGNLPFSETYHIIIVCNYIICNLSPEIKSHKVLFLLVTSLFQVANGHGGEAGDDVEHSNEQNEGQTEGAKASHQSSAVVVFAVVKMICLGIPSEYLV